MILFQYHAYVPMYGAGGKLKTEGEKRLRKRKR